MTITYNAEKFALLRDVVVEALIREINLLKTIGTGPAMQRLSTLNDIVSVFTTQQSILCYNKPGESFVAFETRLSLMAETLSKDIATTIIESPAVAFIRELNWLAFVVAPEMDFSHVEDVFASFNIDESQEEFFTGPIPKLIKISVVIAVALKSSTLWLDMAIANSQQVAKSNRSRGGNEKPE